MKRDIVILLDEIQSTLERLGLWQTIAPIPEKMLSTLPFSMGMLTFTEWLQWIYIARLRALLEANAKLPIGAQVHSYAVESLRVERVKSDVLLAQIAALDSALN